MAHVNILFHAPEATHEAIKDYCNEQRITIKSFMNRAVANELRATNYAILIPDLKVKATTPDDSEYEEVAPKRNHRIKS